jgi:1,4-alpha-glucan branching enzyme
MQKGCAKMELYINTPIASELLKYNPHAVLGIHNIRESEKVIRLFKPGAEEVHLEVCGEQVPATKVDSRGFFECIVSASVEFQDYRIYHQNGLLAHDPYAFLPTFSEVDQHLFNKGVHYNLYKQMGGRLAIHQDVKGVKFTVWAPSAVSVALVGDFNYWNGMQNPMRSLGGCGVWELFVPGLDVGEKYKFEIKTRDGRLLIKQDPFALSSEMRPLTASVIAATESHEWADREWIEMRKENNLNRPINIYEVHLGSWKKKEGRFLNYREIARELALYCNEMGFTHVELLPVSEHPFDESWGYQVTGFFSVTSRFGSPCDFQYFVDHLHQHNIGVILDWVPGHFPTDSFSLAEFDGTSLYEHADPRQGFHPHWNTCIFNFGRHEVSNFLIASALFWLDVYHIDGLRVDAVASMLYLDYGRNEGEWIPNCYGGKENLEAIEFLKHANSLVHKQFPGCLMIAEESTSFRGISHPLEHGGIGFDLKWNMGWMNDTLRYVQKEPIFRAHHHNDLTFGLLYAFSEKFVLVLSHDEVVHGKRSLLSKMPGDMWQKFANLRLLYSYMMCQPGKKLFFMGGEIGQWNEWHCNHEIEWMLLDFPTHRGLHHCVKEINHLYLAHNAFWSNDFTYHGFEWVDFHDASNSVISYLRKSHDEVLFCIHNFTPQYHGHYVVPLRGVARMEEIFNSDDVRYGGSGKVQQGVIIESGHCALCLAPLATAIYKVFWN